MREDLTDAEMLARLERAVRRMPRLQREIFLAIRLDDLSYPEIAERTGLSAREVKRQFANSLLCINYALNQPARQPTWKRLFRWLKKWKCR
ncbi:sigma factor-like helix-turn-helix DNA-binding protein [Sphingomonas mali]|uniref:sigma factor-like helix-turn-helix DNA-binding protein n=1 Tax=Sphingomonas mali TaxID=40682 RepID=UPI0008369986|nr:sigma factor-like helix-turn-helix DNA-binding protein [Sphingomonas mali]